MELKTTNLFRRFCFIAKKVPIKTEQKPEKVKIKLILSNKKDNVDNQRIIKVKIIIFGNIEKMMVVLKGEPS